jgi:cytochrome b subunit of formate dehydrogenase
MYLNTTKKKENVWWDRQAHFWVALAIFLLAISGYLSQVSWTTLMVLDVLLGIIQYLA